MLSNFQSKFQKLSEAQKRALLLEYGINLERETAIKNNIAEDDVYIIENAVSWIFFGELKFEDLPKYFQEELGLSERAAQKLACDLLGLRFLALRKIFSEDNLNALVRQWGGKIENYQAYVLKTAKALSGELPEAEENSAGEPMPIKAEYRALDKIQEIPVALDVFGKNLKDFLSIEGEDLVDLFAEYNYELIQLFFSVGDFKNRLTNVVVGNQEILTSSEFIIDGRLERPTIANWIKDFINQHGSGLFDNLTLTRFSTTSANAKNLTKEERDLVIRLLKTYRNIKFFPESLANLPPEDWEVIALPHITKPEAIRPQENIKPNRPPVFVNPKPSTPKRSAPTPKSALPSQNFTSTSSGAEAVKLTQPAVQSSASPARSKPADAHLLELQAVRDQYPLGSLERMAIEDEVKKHQTNSS